MGGQGLRKLGRFATVGAAATIAYAVFGWLFARLVGLSPFEASVAAYAVAAALSYAGHRWITFRSDRAHAIALPQFLGLTAIGGTIAAALSLAGERLGLPVEAALIATCVAIPLLNYLALDRIVFRGSSAATDLALRRSRDGG